MAFRLRPLPPTSGEPRDRRVTDEQHLAFVRLLPCVASLTLSDVIAHHIRIGHLMAGRKPGDNLAVPLNTDLHQGWPQSLHSMSEGRFWNDLGIDCFSLAAALWAATGDIRRGTAEVHAAHAAGRVRRTYGIRLYPEKVAP